MNRRRVYNLEFPSWCPELNISGYRFSRTEDYDTRVATLHHLATIHAELVKTVNAGTHAQTAYVEIPEDEERAVLPWNDENASRLEDILLLLSLFTGRDVFAVDEEVYNTGNFPITADPRCFRWGGILECSIPYEHKSTAQEPDIEIFDIVDTDEGEKWIPTTIHDPSGYNIGFEKGLNQIYELIRSDEWQKKYRRGFLLFLARSAFSTYMLEPAFIQCWTIWEHLFSALNDNWLGKKGDRQIPSTDRLGFLLVEYGFVESIKGKHSRIENTLVKTRNALVHSGQFPDKSKSKKTAVLFIRLTECLLARILGLVPSNVLNTEEELFKLLGDSGC